MNCSEESKTPLVFHANGGFRLPLSNKGPVFADLIEQNFFQKKTRTNSKPDNLDILLCHNYPEAPLAERCLNHLGMAGHQVLGKEISTFRNFYKISLVLDYVRKHSTADYILHLDARDVLLIDDPKMIVDRFIAQFSCDILFNAEKGSHPGIYPGIAPDDQTKIRAIEQFEQSTYPGPFFHLNSGCYIGHRAAVIEMLEEAVSQEGFLASFPNDDQGIIRDVHRRWYPRIQIDHQCLIFQCLYLMKKEELKTPYQITPWDTHYGTLKMIYWNFVLQPSKIRQLLQEQLRFTYSNWATSKN